MEKRTILTYQETGKFDEHLNNLESILNVRERNKIREQEILEGRTDSLGIPRIFWGYVNANGTAGIPFPKGWTSSLSLVTYTITHNLATTNYVVIAIALLANTERFAEIQARNINNFQLKIYSGGTQTDTNFMFILLI